jgi:hypothetical protein
MWTPTAVTSTSVPSNPAPLAKITLVNPSQNGVTLAYELDGVSYSLAPGYQQEVRRVCVIEFDCGGSAGLARYTLSNGTYTFTPANGAWDLFHSSTDTPGAAQNAGPASDPVPITGARA